MCTVGAAAHAGSLVLVQVSLGGRTCRHGALSSDTGSSSPAVSAAPRVPGL